MRLRIYDGSPHEEGVTYLRLIVTDPDHVMLAAVDQGGQIILDSMSWDHGSGLLTITADGTLSLSPAVMPSLGFELDAAGRIKLDAYAEMKTAQHAQRFGGKRAAFRVVEDGPPG